MSKDPVRSAVRAEVRRILTGSPAFRELPPETQRQLAHDMVRVAHALVLADDPSGAAHEVARSLRASGKSSEHIKARGAPRTKLFERKHDGASLRDVDLPNFVADLLKGVFDANIDGSIKQMHAYAELIREVSASLGDFIKDDDDDDD